MNNIDLPRDNKVWLSALGYGFLVWLCYSLSENILSTRSFLFLAIALAIPLLFLIKEKPLLLLLLFVIYYNTVFPRKFLPIPLIANILFSPPELFLVVGYYFVLRDQNRSLDDLFLGTPVRRMLGAFILLVPFYVLWGYLVLNLHLLGSVGMVYNARALTMYLVFFLILAFLESEIHLRKYFKCLLFLAILGSVLHILIFLGKGHGFWADLFPVFTGRDWWLPLERMTTGTYYGTTTQYFRINNPFTPLIRCCLMLSVSFYLHTRDRKWLFTALLFVIPVILQFGRMTWVSYIVVFPLFFPIMARDTSQTEIFQRIRGLPPLFKYVTLLIATGILLYILGMIGVIPLRLVSERLLSVFAGTKEMSINARLQEALGYIKYESTSVKYLLFGVGLPFMSGDSSFVALFGSMGLVGLGAYCSLAYIYCRQGLTIYYRLKTPYLKALCLGSVLSYFQFLVSGLGNFSLLAAPSIPTLCFLFAIPELSAKFEGLSYDDYKIHKKERGQAVSG